MKLRGELWGKKIKTYFLTQTTIFAHRFLIQTETSQNQQSSYFLTLHASLPSDQVPIFASAASHQHTAATRLPSLSLESCCIEDQALEGV